MNDRPRFSLPAIRPRAAIWIPVFVAFAIRIAYLMTLRNSPVYGVPILDEAVNDGWAHGGMRAMYDAVAYLRAPGYMWFLKLVYAIHDGPFFVRLVQVVISTATVGLVADVGRRVGGPLAGLVGGMLLAFCWPAVYFAGELLAVTWFSFLILLGLWALVLATLRRSPGLAYVAAIVLGLASIVRPMALVMLPAMIWFGARSFASAIPTLQGRIRVTALLLLLLLLPGITLTIRNQVVGGEAVFIATGAGSSVADQGEIKDPDFWRARNPVLSPPLYSSGAILFGMGIVGLFLARRRAAAVPLNLFVVLYGAGLLLFARDETSRLPEFMVLAGFAGVPVAAGVEHWRERRAASVGIAVSVLLLLAVGEFGSVWFHGNRVGSDALSEYTLGTVWMRCGNPEKAAEAWADALDTIRRDPPPDSDRTERMIRYNLVSALLKCREQSAAEDQMRYFKATWPDDNRVRILEGQLLAWQHRHRQAFPLFRAAVDADSQSIDALVGLGRSQLEARSWSAAENTLRKAMSIGGPRADILANLGLVELVHRQNRALSLRLARRALKLDPSEPQAHYLLGEDYRRNGNYPAMLYHFRRVLLADPNNPKVSRFLLRSGVDPKELIENQEISPPPEPE